MFESYFTCTHSASIVQSVFEVVLGRQPGSPSVGMYNRGLLAVVDSESSTAILEPWSWLVGEECAALATTGFGDVFFWQPSEKLIKFLDVQRGTTEFIDADIDWFLDEFLTNQDILENVLKKSQLESLVQRYRPLEYHEAFILQPWLRLGGVDMVENYVIGQCSVYLDLVCQSLRSG